MADEHKRDRWDKVTIILQPLGGLLTALAIAFLGIYSSAKLEVGRERETRSTLYIELMNRREEAESALRKDMFASLMNSYLGTDKDTPESRLLKLELLTYNFHESLNLKPLFYDLQRQIERETGGNPDRKAEALDRLLWAAREINNKQMAVLEGAGESFGATIALDSSGQPDPTVVHEDTLNLEGITRKFSIRVLNAESESKSLNVFLTVSTIRDSSRSNSSGNGNGKVENISATFNVSFYDFPMIDNIRLSHDQRCSVVLRNLSPSSAKMSLIYFPGAYASLKEKPYYQEVLDKLQAEDTK